MDNQLKKKITIKKKINRTVSTADFESFSVGAEISEEVEYANDQELQLQMERFQELLVVDLLSSLHTGLDALGVLPSKGKMIKYGSKKKGKKEESIEAQELEFPSGQDPFGFNSSGNNGQAPLVDINEWGKKAKSTADPFSLNTDGESATPSPPVPNQRPNFGNNF
jgi:hypothetical protein